MIDSTLEPGPPHLRGARDRGRGRRARCWSRPTSATRRSRTTTCRASRSRRCSRKRARSSAALRHTYRFLFAPGTIGPLAWLHQQPGRLDRDRARADALVHRRRRRPHLQAQPPRRRRRRPRRWRPSCATRARPHRVLPWEPWGGDERQFCSPGFDLPVGTLMRTPHGEFDGYHTSADALERIRPESLAEAVETCLELVDVLETNRRCINLSPYGEPQLGRRGLYRSAGGRGRDARRRAGAAVGAQPERRRRQPARHRPRSGLRLPGHPACRRAARAGRPAGRGPRPRSRAAAVSPAELDLRPAVRARAPGCSRAGPVWSPAPAAGSAARSRSGWSRAGRPCTRSVGGGTELEAMAARGDGAGRFETYEVDLVVDEQVGAAGGDAGGARGRGGRARSLRRHDRAGRPRNGPGRGPRPTVRDERPGAVPADPGAAALAARDPGRDRLHQFHGWADGEGGRSPSTPPPSTRSRRSPTACGKRSTRRASGC